MLVTSLLGITIADGRWLGSRVVSVLDRGAVGPGFKSQPRRCRITVLGKLFTPIVPLFLVEGAVEAAGHVIIAR